MQQVSQIIKHYEIIEQIGDGGFGHVYKARDTNTGRIVALKEIKYRKSSDDYGISMTTLREIKLLAGLKHINIVELIDVTSIDFGPSITLDQVPPLFLVMEYIDHDLSGILLLTRKNAIQPLSLELLRYYAYQLFQGLAYLHEHRVMHRDLKTCNILLTNSNIIKIADFGWARYRIKSLKKYTKGIITIWYRPPEILLEESEYSYEVDIWSAGCIVAELFICYPLFYCKKASNDEALKSILQILGMPLKHTYLMNLIKKSNLNIDPEHYTNNFKDYFTQKFTQIYSHDIVPEGLIDLLLSCFNYNPLSRPTAREILEHPYFTSTPIQTTLSLPDSDKLLDTHEYIIKQRDKKQKSLNATLNNNNNKHNNITKSSATHNNNNNDMNNNDNDNNNKMNSNNNDNDNNKMNNNNNNNDNNQDSLLIKITDISPLVSTEKNSVSSNRSTQKNTNISKSSSSLLPPIEENIKSSFEKEENIKNNSESTESSNPFTSFINPSTTNNKIKININKHILNNLATLNKNSEKKDTSSKSQIKLNFGTKTISTNKDISEFNKTINNEKVVNTLITNKSLKSKESLTTSSETLKDSLNTSTKISLNKSKSQEIYKYSDPMDSTHDSKSSSHKHTSLSSIDLLHTTRESKTLIHSKESAENKTVESKVLENKTVENKTLENKVLQNKTIENKTSEMKPKSPRNSSRSTRHQSRSPRNSSRSTRHRRSISPRYHSSSIRYHSSSIRYHSRSPRNSSRSPRYHSRSPRNSSRSPRYRSSHYRNSSSSSSSSISSPNRYSYSTNYKRHSSRSNSYSRRYRDQYSSKRRRYSRSYSR